jgi:hypothetical protein
VVSQAGAVLPVETAGKAGLDAVLSTALALDHGSRRA